MRTRQPDMSKFEEHRRYMEEITPILMDAEATVERIKGSAEWKRSYGYFQTLYNRGILKERPTRANGYKIEKGYNQIALADIEDLLTPEQIEAIKDRL